jgi:hypothetical protein
MDWTAIFASAIVAAVVSGGSASIPPTRRRRATANLKNSNKKSSRELEQLKDRLTHKTTYAAEDIFRTIFKDQKYPQRVRSLVAIRRRINAFTDEELRKILVGMGAERITVSRSEDYRLQKGKDEDFE